jgi:hypothetical protein
MIPSGPRTPWPVEARPAQVTKGGGVEEEESDRTARCCAAILAVCPRVISSMSTYSESCRDSRGQEDKESVLSVHCCCTGSRSLLGARAPMA